MFKNLPMKDMLLSIFPLKESLNIYFFNLQNISIVFNQQDIFWEEVLLKWDLHFKCIIYVWEVIIPTCLYMFSTYFVDSYMGNVRGSSRIDVCQHGKIFSLLTTIIFVNLKMFFQRQKSWVFLIISVITLFIIV